MKKMSKLSSLKIIYLDCSFSPKDTLFGTLPKHILLEYDTTESGEVCLQCFMLGNGHVSFPVMATVLYGFFTMPEYYGLFVKAFDRGKLCREISDWNWYELLHSETKNIQTLLKPA